jgi:predicted transcriptional regulator
VKGITPRSYRSKLEVLRDFLRAAQEPAPKTRIIGAANLNPVSFTRYLRVCTAHDLIASVSGGYVATPRATSLLEAIDDLIVKRNELERALRVLERNTLDDPDSPPVDGNPFRHVLRDAWNEIGLQAEGASGSRRRRGMGGAAGPASNAAARARDGITWTRSESPVITVRAQGRRSSARRPGDDEPRSPATTQSRSRS